MSLDEFVRDLNESVLAESQATGDDPELVFTRNAVEYLTDTGECLGPDPFLFKARGYRADGWDLQEENSALDLFVTRFVPGGGITKIPKGQVLDALSRGRRFVERCVDGAWGEITASAEALDAAKEIHRVAGTLRLIRIFLLTNALCPDRKLEDSKLGKTKIAYIVCDIDRLNTIASGGVAREPIELARSQLGGGLPCVPIADASGSYDSYLGVISGSVLADLYHDWGDRLLEHNVRSYLQARGKVNRGILETLRSEPRMFLAYNNGISATAEHATTSTGQSHQVVITGLRNFQIVNGGQTTATLHIARYREGLDLAGVNVQLKLTVIRDAASVERIVPQISKFANSQTKVTLSDFSANDPFQMGLEQLSRHTWTPVHPGRPASKWFYERTRGRYLTELGGQGSPGKRTAFQNQFPKSQVLTKILAAKCEMAWAQRPHVVSLGGEKNFSNFIDELGRSVRSAPSEDYFRRLVALVILYRECDLIVEGRAFGGYKANVVAYSIAWLSYLTAQCLDLQTIWNEQEVGDGVRQALYELATDVWAHLNAPPPTVRNVTEWCKKEACWRELRSRPKSLPTLSKQTTNPETLGALGPISVGPSAATPPADAEKVIVAAQGVSKETWFGLAAWAKKTGNLEPWERKLAFSMGRIRGRGWTPTEKQARHGMRILGEAREKGYDAAGAATS